MEEMEFEHHQKILNLQNGDGTWAGHHCITGRVGGYQCGNPQPECRSCELAGAPFC
jgi:hypothetical protein